MLNQLRHGILIFPQEIIHGIKDWNFFGSFFVKKEQGDIDKVQGIGFNEDTKPTQTQRRGP